jgi:hydroxymethylpyrimidine/phosphomethylpyrimidine kinase
MSSHPPIVLCFSGHDPSGGAGIQADIETIISHQCHCCSVITALTEQDSHNVKQVLPQPPDAIIRQAETIAADFAVAAIKIGLIGHVETAAAIRRILLQHPDIPVVLDPVLAAGGGAVLAGQDLYAAIREWLIPLTTVLTPNTPEARQLAQHQSLSECGKILLAHGADAVLITGTHEPSTQVENQLHTPDHPIQTFYWERLPYSYHGSGCTLSAAIAALLAQGLDVFTAVNEAQDFTWQALAAAYQPGHGQYHPQRLFWVAA